MSDLISKFTSIRVLIAGDVMLDRYWWGSVSRISPEAPVPVVHVTRRSEVPGGAANVARNVLGLGAKPTLLGGIGTDKDGDDLKRALNDVELETTDLIEIDDWPTTVKTRVVAHNQHVVRVDQESPARLPAEIEGQFLERLDEYVGACDVVILSDYMKGFLSNGILDRLIRSARRGGKPVIVDPKGRDFSKYSGATTITPNRGEAIDAAGVTGNDNASIDAAGSILSRSLDIPNVLITLGENGMALFENGKPPKRLEAETQETYDVTGAGDTVVACIAVGLAAGLSFEESARLANVAAGIVVSQVGTTSVSAEALSSKLSIRSSALTER